MNDKRDGRPRLNPAEKLKYRVAVKLCTEDFYALNAKSSAAGMTPTELARLAIVGCKIRQRLTTEQMNRIRQIAGMGNNLNQIARRANAEGYSNTHSECLILADRIDNALTLLENGSENS
jgi:hypothetical protein